MANSIITTSLALDREPATVIAEIITERGLDPERLLRTLSKEFASAAGAVRGSEVSVRVDSITPGVSNRSLPWPTITDTITHANLVANTDTLVIGNVTITWVAAAANENQVTIGANATADGDNLVAKINAHSKLAGLFFATNASGVVAIEYRGDPRTAALIGASEAGTGQVLSATSFTTDATTATGSAAVRHRKGL